MKAGEISARLLSLQKEIERITEPNASWLISELLNLIEDLGADYENSSREVQSLKDEINRLKGEQGKPDIKSNKSSDNNDDNDFSSEKERREAESTGEIGQKEGFKLSQPSLEKLKERDIPMEILDSLDKLKRKKFSNKVEFLAAIEAVIGAEAKARYGSLLVKYARYKKRKREPKIPDIPIDRTKRCVVDVEKLPDDAVSKGIKEKVVQYLF